MLNLSGNNIGGQLPELLDMIRATLADIKRREKKGEDLSVVKTIATGGLALVLTAIGLKRRGDSWRRKVETAKAQGYADALADVRQQWNWSECREDFEGRLQHLEGQA